MRVPQASQPAVGQIRMLTRTSAHTVRHRVASHVLQANDAIPTIQACLGHRDVRPTMIYTHTVARP